MKAFYPMLPKWILRRLFVRSQVSTIESTPELTIETPQAGDQVSVEEANRATLPVNSAEGDIARELTHIWEKLLGVESLALDENYFDLGGDSSLTIQLFVQIDKTFGVRLPIITLFEAPTVRELATAIMEVKSRASEMKVPTGTAS